MPSAKVQKNPPRPIARASDWEETIPTQTGNSGKVLGTNGTELSWVTGGSGGGGSVNIYTEPIDGTSVVVNHGAGVRPQVWVIETSSGETVETEVDHGSVNQFTVSTNVHLTGTIYYSY